MISIHVWSLAWFNLVSLVTLQMLTSMVFLDSFVVYLTSSLSDSGGSKSTLLSIV